MSYQLKEIGKVKNDETGAFIQLEPEYIPGRQWACWQTDYVQGMS